MILRLLRRVKPVGLLINYPRRCMALTAIKRKDFEPKETFYTLLGVAENAEPMEIEDAFVKVLTDDELVIDATKVGGWLYLAKYFIFYKFQLPNPDLSQLWRRRG